WLSSRRGGDMKRRGKASGRPAKSRRSRAPTRRKTPATSLRISDLQARIDSCVRELNESREQQSATSEVLKAISRSPDDLQPVFQTIGARAEKLCGAEISVIAVTDGDQIRLASINGISPEGVEAVRRAFPMKRSEETITARAVRTSKICHVPDV